MENLIGWIIWGALVFFATNWTFGIYYYLRKKRRVSRASILQTFSFWIIAIVFLSTGWNKLHIIWLVPLVYLTEMVTSPSLFGGVPLKYSFLGALKMLSPRKNNERLRNKIKRLTAEINEENKKITSLLKKYRDNQEALSNLPEFSDPYIIVPQTCKRQLVVYLKSKLKDLREKGCLRSVLVSRFDDNPLNPGGLKADDFKNFLDKSNIGLPDLCKEILKREQNPENNKTKQALIDELVDEYFAGQ